MSERTDKQTTRIRILAHAIASTIYPQHASNQDALYKLLLEFAAEIKLAATEGDFR